MKEIKVGNSYTKEELSILGFLHEKDAGNYSRYSFEDGKKKAIFERGQDNSLLLEMWYLTEVEKDSLTEKNLLKYHKDLLE
jgi:hypothetical protein